MSTPTIPTVSQEESELDAATFALRVMREDRASGFGLYAALSEAAYKQAEARAIVRVLLASAAVFVKEAV